MEERISVFPWPLIARSREFWTPIGKAITMRAQQAIITPLRRRKPTFSVSQNTVSSRSVYQCGNVPGFSRERQREHRGHSFSGLLPFPCSGGGIETDSDGWNPSNRPTLEGGTRSEPRERLGIFWLELRCRFWFNQIPTIKNQCGW